MNEAQEFQGQLIELRDLPEGHLSADTKTSGP